MTFRPTQLERAFELARSGTCQNVTEIKSKLLEEGYSVDQVSGPKLVKQLRELSTLAAATAAEPTP